jgi:hypothetical protein
MPFSLERIQGYLDIEHEKPATEAGKPPAYWPGSGDLRVERFSARYSEEGPKVLDDISFHVKSGERVGIGAHFYRNFKLIYIVAQWVGPVLGRYFNLVRRTATKADRLTEFLDALAPKMHSYTRFSDVRWARDLDDEPGCVALEHHDHTPSRQCISS